MKYHKYDINHIEELEVELDNLKKEIETKLCKIDELQDQIDEYYNEIDIKNKRIMEIERLLDEYDEPD